MKTYRLLNASLYQQKHKCNLILWLYSILLQAFKDIVYYTLDIYYTLHCSCTIHSILDIVYYSLFYLMFIIYMRVYYIYANLKEARKGFFVDVVFAKR